MTIRAIIAAAAGLLIVPAAAQAAGWSQVTTAGGNSDQVALLRTGDGILHVAWQRSASPATEDLLHTTLSPSGKLLGTTTIQSGWSVVQNPALVAAPEGIRAFWGGIRTTATEEPNSELNTALSADGGATWALQIGSVVPGDAQAHGSPVAAAALPGGTFLQAWAGTLGTWVHSGLSPAAPNRDLQAPFGAYGYDTGIAADAAGRAVVAWYSSAAARRGVLAQEVAADGAPVGSTLSLPGTANMRFGQLGRTAIVARPGGGFYVASATGYPALNKIRLWRVGAARAATIARTPGTRGSTATLAAAADGRLWVVWIADVGGTPHVLASRSNTSAATFGAVVDAGRPGRALQAYRLDASVAGGALDILGSFSLGTTPNVATFHRRVLPGLTLKASRLRLPRGDSTSVTFTVLDAGVAVKGARVRAGGASGTTNAAGKVTLRLTGAGRSLGARATAAGYVAAARVLRVIGP